MSSSGDSDYYLTDWWFDPRAQGGWRLSLQGLTVLQDLNTPIWWFDFPKKQQSFKTLLVLTKQVNVPYYISVRDFQLAIADSETAVIIRLYGSVERWVHSVEALPQS